MRKQKRRKKKQEKNSFIKFLMHSASINWSQNDSEPINQKSQVSASETCKTATDNSVKNFTTTPLVDITHFSHIIRLFLRRYFG